MKVLFSKEKIGTLLPYWIFMVCGEAMYYLTFLGPRPSRLLIAGVCLVPLFGIYLLDFIPPVHRFLAWILEKCSDFIKQIPNHRWKRFCLMALTDGLLGLVTERVFNWGLAFNWRFFLWAFVCFFVPSLLLVFRDWLTEKVELSVFLIVLSVGTIFSTALPVSTGICWDDETHFHNILMLSRLADARMSAGDYEELCCFEKTALEHDRYTLESHVDWVKYLNEKDRNEEWVGVGRKFPTPMNLCYLPSALGNLVGKTLHLPYNIIFILGRWFNLLAYSILVYLAVKKIKTGKILIAVASLIPPVLFMAGEYSRDAWMIAWTMVAYSWLIGEIQTPEKKLTLFDVCFMLTAFALGIAPKAIYFPLMLICLFMPKEKFSHPKWHRLYLAVFAAGALIALSSFAVPYILSKGGNHGDGRGGSGVSSASQTSFILGDPFGYAKILFSFLGEYFSQASAKTYLNYMHYFGTAPYPLVTEGMLILVALTDRGEADAQVKWTVKLSTLVASFLSIVLAATAMYVSFTPYKYETILGCQYRYMFQIFFPVLFVLGGFKFENKLIKNYSYEKKIPQGIYRGIILAIMSFILLNGLWVLLIKGFM